MTDYPQKVSDSFNERLRLIRLRRKKESLRFWDEFRIIPRWLIGAVIFLYVLSALIFIFVDLKAPDHGGLSLPPELQNDPVLASVAIAGILAAFWILMGTFIFLVAYVNRDAKRRGMHAALWTLLALLLSWPFPFLGVIIYFLMREPLPYPCPQCGNSVGARFNFCPNCKCNLHPSCAQCKREVAETDKYCPNCGNDLKAAAPAVEVSAQNPV